MTTAEIPLGEALAAIAKGNAPPPDREFPSREAADAYHVVRAWARRQNRHGMTEAEVRQAMRDRWPLLPWWTMQRWAMIKTAAKMLREHEC